MIHTIPEGILSSILLFIYLLICCYTDIKTKTISLKTTIIFIIIAIIINIFIYNNSLIYFAASAFAGILLFIISIIFPASLGKGDGIMIAVCGFYSGLYFSFKLLLFALLFSAVYSVIMLIKKRSVKYSFPFAPFLLMSYILSFIMTLI